MKHAKEETMQPHSHPDQLPPLSWEGTPLPQSELHSPSPPQD
jgi:hypothetical protein